MVYFCLQVSLNFVCKPFTNIFTLANSKNFENNFFLYLKIFDVNVPTRVEILTQVEYFQIRLTRVE